MADQNNPLLGQLLSRAQGIGPASPTDRPQPLPGEEMGGTNWNPIMGMLRLTGMNDPVGSGSVGAGGPIGGAVLERAEPSLVENLHRNVKFDKLTTPASELYKLLMNYKAPAAEVADVTPEIISRRFAPPLDARTALSRAVSRVPEAAGKLEAPALTLKRPKGFYTEYNKQANFHNIGNRVAKTKELIKDTPNTASSLEDVLLAAKAGTPVERVKPAISGVPSRGLGLQLQNQRLAKSGLTVDMIREIRKLGLNAAAEKYPNMNKRTLASIVNKLSWNTIPD
jgi:hypothetical protein